MGFDDIFDWNDLLSDPRVFDDTSKFANDGWYNDFLADMHNKKVPNPKDPSGTIAVSSLRHKRYAPEGKKIFDQLYENWKKHNIKGSDFETHPDHVDDPVPTITSIRQQDKENREKERDQRKNERAEKAKARLERKKKELEGAGNDSPETKKAPNEPTKAPEPKKNEWSPASAVQKKLDAKRLELEQKKAPVEQKQPDAPAKSEPTKTEHPAQQPEAKKPEVAKPSEVENKPSEIEQNVQKFVEQKKKERDLRRQREKDKQIALEHLKRHVDSGALTPQDAEDFKKQFGIQDEKKPEPKKPEAPKAPDKSSPEYIAKHAEGIAQQKFSKTLNNIKTNEHRLRGNVAALPGPTENDSVKDEIKDRAGAIADVFKSNGIDSGLQDVTTGPNFSTYHMSITPEAYHKVSRNKDIADYISLKSQVSNSRIELNKKKGTLDIQIPNKKRHIVPWKQLATDPEYLNKVQSNQNSLHTIIGQDNAGGTKSIDLDKEPHVGIVGGTGSGKTVTLNGMISSILSNKKPEEMQLSIVDVGKQGAGFRAYNGVSNMAQPVIDNEEDAHKLFRGLSASIDTRNQLIKRVGGSINDFNNFIRKDPNSMSEDEKKTLETIPPEQRKIIPRHVIAVDEFADLMRRYEHGKDRQDFIKNVVGLAQLGRSAGVHLLLATQHPNDRSLPKDVWRQLGTRLVHKVNDESASNYVGVKDAHKLNKHGDMIAVTDGDEDRVQAGYISSEQKDANGSQTTDVDKFLSNMKGRNPVDQNRFKKPARPPSADELAIQKELGDWNSEKNKKAV